jgi:hypothetical protein
VWTDWNDVRPLGSPPVGAWVFAGLQILQARASAPTSIRDLAQPTPLHEALSLAADRRVAHAFD